MEVNDVLNLPWIKVRNWSGLSATATSLFAPSFYCETDIDAFVENIYRDVSRKLRIPYEQLSPILKGENVAFYSLKKQIFKDFTGIGEDSSKFIALKNTLMIPDTSEFKVSVEDDNLSRCLKLFESLSDSEKILFLQKIGKINVKIEYSAAQAEEYAVD